MPEPQILLRANLATPRRTVMGIFGHLQQSDLPEGAERSFLIECGLPPIALEEPDIPITHEQQLDVMARLIERMDPSRSVPHHALEVGLGVHLTVFGVLGLTMMYASSMQECLRVITTYPELSWGHSQLTAGVDGGRVFQAFAMDEHLVAGNPALRQYCETLDLTASVRMTRDLVGPGHAPLEIWLPYPPPRDHREMRRRLVCPVRFDAPEARIYFPPSLLGVSPLLANPLVFRAYEKLTAQLARRLRTDVPLAEQVRRLLWVSSPPPDRDAVASMLALSPRTLARKLAAEDTSYGELQREVRFARAQELLRDPKRPIARIADELGFSDAAAFSRAFRTWTGQTPSAWRRDA